VASDLEQIESRGAAWLAGEQWKLDAIADTTRPSSGREGGRQLRHGLRRGLRRHARGVMEDKKRNGFWRQVGKVMELAKGYEGGVGAWLAFAMVYRLDLESWPPTPTPACPAPAREQAEIIWDWRAKKGLTTFGLSRKTFVVIEAFKTLWREAHPAISSYWGELDDAAKEAIRYPGHEIEARRLAFEKKGAWLRMILPSGRVLCYPAPRIETVKGKETITYAGVNQYSRQVDAASQTYGGKLFENATQATARDVMAYNMPEIEDGGLQRSCSRSMTR
jgi:DNA polymerase